MSEFQSRFLHTRIRVRDIDRSVSFYTEVFGFKEFRRSVSPAGNQLCFLQLPGNETLIELCSAGRRQARFLPGSPSPKISTSSR